MIINERCHGDDSDKNTIDSESFHCYYNDGMDHDNIHDDVDFNDSDK